MCTSSIEILPHPFWPGLGALLLKVRAVLCLNFGGAFRVAGAATAMSAIVARLLREGTETNKFVHANCDSFRFICTCLVLCWSRCYFFSTCGLLLEKCLRTEVTTVNEMHCLWLNSIFVSIFIYFITLREFDNIHTPNDS